MPVHKVPLRGKKETKKKKRKQRNKEEKNRGPYKERYIEYTQTLASKATDHTGVVMMG